jgi:hypothetical protein
MREKKTISGDELLKRKVRLNKRTGDSTKRIRMKRRLQLHDDLSEYADRSNDFWLLRTRHINNINRK